MHLFNTAITAKLSRRGVAYPETGRFPSHDSSFLNSGKSMALIHSYYWGNVTLWARPVSRWYYTFHPSQAAKLCRRRKNKSLAIFRVWNPQRTLSYGCVLNLTSVMGAGIDLIWVTALCSTCANKSGEPDALFFYKEKIRVAQKVAE